MRRSIPCLLSALTLSGVGTVPGQAAFAQTVQLVTPPPLSTGVRVSTTRPPTLDQPSVADSPDTSNADGPRPADSLMAEPVRPESHLSRVADVEPLPVVLPDGQDAGRVSAALMNDAGDVQYVAIAWRHRDYFVPYAALAASPIDGLLQLNATPRQFQEAPRYFAHRWPDINSPTFVDVAAAGFTGVASNNGIAGDINQSAPVSALSATSIPPAGMAAAASGSSTVSAIPQPLIDSPLATTAPGVPSLALPLGMGVVRTREAGVDVTAVPTAPVPARPQTAARPATPTSAMFPQAGNTAAAENGNNNYMVAPLLFGAGRAPRAFNPPAVNSPALKGGAYAPNWVGNSVPSVIYPNTTAIQNGGSITGVNAATQMQSGVSRGNTFIPGTVFSGQGGNSTAGAGIGAGRGMSQPMTPASRYPVSVIRPTYVGPGANPAYNTTGGVGTAGGVGTRGGGGINNGGQRGGSVQSSGATQSTTGPAARP